MSELEEALVGCLTSWELPVGPLCTRVRVLSCSCVPARPKLTCILQRMHASVPALGAGQGAPHSTTGRRALLGRTQMPVAAQWAECALLLCCFCFPHHVHKPCLSMQYIMQP
jgi:hypothetical protein